jgi:hypothetical protein
MNRIKAALLPTCLLGGVAGLGAIIISCGTSSPSGPVGGAVAGPQDMHCVGMPVQPTNDADCYVGPTVIDAPPAPDSPDAPSGFGATMYNDDGKDDDCKYSVTWTSTPIREDDNVFYTVVAKYLAMGSGADAEAAGAPATGANIYAEVFKGTTHAAPPTNQAATENPPGTYRVGPIQFDEPGSDGDPWTVRFHLHENCIDYQADSPHGHAAFYMEVP